LRGDRVLTKTKELVVVFFSLTLITAITTVAPAYQDSIFTYSDAAYTQPARTFDDGDTIFTWKLLIPIQQLQVLNQ